MELIATGIISIATTLLIIIIFFKHSFNYWKRKGIAHDKPIIPFGSLRDSLLKVESAGIIVEKFYKAAKAAGYKEYGLFALWRPIYMPIDPLQIKRILSADFHFFPERGSYYYKKTDPLGAHLFNLTAKAWKPLRTKLTPSFTSGKTKMMLPIILQCGKQLKEAVDSLAFLNEPIDVRDLVGKFTTDVIGSCAFGLECNSFKNENSDFLKYSKQVFVDTYTRRLKIFLTFCFPRLSLKLGVNITYKEVTKFFLSIVKETVKYREQNNVKRNDFMQLLIDLKNEKNANGAPHLTLEEVAAQAFIFFIAGYETSSITMAFCLYELSINPKIQEDIRDEINRVLEKTDGEVTYEATIEMKYMGQAIDETLRKYPPVPFLFRQSIHDYQIPGTNKILDKGTSVFISSLGLHYDPEHFPNPEAFDPSRFSDENKHNIKPFTYIPFGEGPRGCLGIRFGILQMKLGLIYLLRNFKFSLNQKTQTPLIMDPSSFTLLTIGGIWLNISRVNK